MDRRATVGEKLGLLVLQGWGIVRGLTFFASTPGRCVAGFAAVKDGCSWRGGVGSVEGSLWDPGRGSRFKR